RHLEVIPNPLPPELLDAPVAPRTPNAQGRRQILAMGRLVPQKQFDVLIRAFAAIAPDHPDWDLVIWGEGPMRSELMRLITEGGLTVRVSLPGRTDVPWVELSRASAFALTSAVEGFPNVLLE